MKVFVAFLGIAAVAGCGKNQSTSATEDIALYAKGGTPYSLYLEGENKVVLKKCRVQTDNYRDCKAVEEYTTDLGSFSKGLLRKSGLESEDSKLTLEDVAKKNKDYLTVLSAKGDSKSAEYQRTAVVSDFANNLVDTLKKIKAGEKATVTAATDAIFATVMRAINVEQRTIYRAEQDCQVTFYTKKGYYLEAGSPTKVTASGESHVSPADALVALSKDLQLMCTGNEYKSAVQIYGVRETSRPVLITRHGKEAVDVDSPFEVFCQITRTPAKIFEPGKVHMAYFVGDSWSSGVRAEVKPYYQGHAELFLTEACESYARNAYSDVMSVKVIERSLTNK